MRVIFLDIDGVLVNRASFRLPRVPWKGKTVSAARAHPDCVAALNRLTETTSAVFVLSSVWRMFGITFMRSWLKACGVKGKLIGMTPTIRETSGLITVQAERGIEIQAWLDAHEEQIKSFVILDDDADMAHLLPRLVHTQFEPGLTEQDATRAISFLATEASDELSLVA